MRFLRQGGIQISLSWNASKNKHHMPMGKRMAGSLTAELLTTYTDSSAKPHFNGLRKIFDYGNDTNLRWINRVWTL
jgi:hypothetical protein